MLDKIKINKIIDFKLENISDDVYFSDKFSDFVSNSKLSLINPEEGGSAKKFKEGLGEHKIFSSALELGSAVHELVLQPEYFYLNYEVEKSTGKPAFMIDYIIKNGGELNKEWILKASKKFDYFKGNPTDNKIGEIISKNTDYFNYMLSEKKLYDNEALTAIYLSGYDRMRAEKCVLSVTQNNTFKRLLKPVCLYKDPFIRNEATVLLVVEFKVPFKDGYELVQIKLKGKLDNYTVDYDEQIITLNDLKTTGKSIEFFSESFERYHYARQMGLYLWMLKNIYKDILINYKLQSNILVVQTTPDYTSKVFPVSLETIQKGLEEASSLLKRVAFHTVYGFEKELEEYEGF